MQKNHKNRGPQWKTQGLGKKQVSRTPITGVRHPASDLRATDGMGKRSLT